MRSMGRLFIDWKTQTGMEILGDQPVRRLTIGAYLAVGALLIAHGVNAFVAAALALPPAKGAAPQSAQIAASVALVPQQWVDQIQSSGLFLLPAAPLGMTGVPGTASPTPVRAALGVANKLRLLGVVLGRERGVFAIVEELATKRQVLYRLHDQIPDLGEVSAIRRDGLVIRSGDQEELLELSTTDKPAAPVVTAGSPVIGAPGVPIKKVIDRREVEAAMADLPKLLTQARAVPFMVNGSPNGYRMDYIAPASFYEKIGIQHGDVLQRVNGVDVRDPSTMLSLFQQLKNERTVNVDMVRNNQKTTMTFELR
ncbi:type II secretion system protein N [Nitrospira lenta]|nr:type II secretion system protein N [Nitrospira lenta]